MKTFYVEFDVIHWMRGIEIEALFFTKESNGTLRFYDRPGSRPIAVFEHATAVYEKGAVREVKSV